MNKIWQTIRGYIWWTHERGSFHYDVMVTLILLFIFVTPHFVDFHDKPAERRPHQTDVQILSSGDGFIYRIDASAVKGSSDAEIRSALLKVIEPIAGEVKLSKYEPVNDTRGQLSAYKVWVHRR
jgi:hypothetical protein